MNFNIYIYIYIYITHISKFSKKNITHISKKFKVAPEPEIWIKLII